MTSEAAEKEMTAAEKLTQLANDMRDNIFTSAQIVPAGRQRAGYLMSVAAHLNRAVEEIVAEGNKQIKEDELVGPLFELLGDMKMEDLDMLVSK